jgi:hypothetical protein
VLVVVEMALISWLDGARECWFVHYGICSIVSLQIKGGSIRGCYLLRKTLPLGGLKRENSISAVDLGCWKDAFQKLTRFILRRVIARLLCSEEYLDAIRSPCREVEVGRMRLCNRRRLAASCDKPSEGTSCLLFVDTELLTWITR